MKRHAHVILLLVLAVTASAQLKVTSIQRLPLGTEREWSTPQFSPDGTSIYFTASDFNGIWEYSLANRSMRLVTDDRGSGYGFAVSRDGAQIAYRRTSPVNGTSINTITHRRSQEIVTKNLVDGSSSIVSRGATLSLPIYSGSNVVSSSGKEMNAPPGTAHVDQVSVLGIEDTKIALLRGGQKVLLDPLGNGSYIWPSLSADGKYIVAYEMDRGTFVCDVAGKVTSKLGRKDAPAWTRDGRWIVYMNDKDDGHRILSSDIICVSPDGKEIIQLTDTRDVIEMYPQCSPTEDKIVCNTLRGDVYVISYAESGR